MSLHCFYIYNVKKITVIAVFLFYSLAAFGVSVNYFYCCGKLKEVSLKLDKPPVHHKCPMKGDKDCCKDESVDLKLDQQQHASQQIVFEPLLFIVQPDANIFDAFERFISQQQYSNLQNKPPPLVGSSLNILHSNFRI